jgi:O-antigen ligase
MEVREKIPASAVTSLIKGLFFSAMFTLPWINLVHISTILFIAMGCVAVLFGKKTTEYSWYKKQLLFLFFAVYYSFEVITFCMHPHTISIHGDIERKASLIFIPVLLLLVMEYENIWHIGIKGFIYGNTVAALYCFIVATFKYTTSKNISVYFYHHYANTIGLSAIYFSLDLIVVLGYIITLSFQKAYTPGLAIALTSLGVFLFFNLLLLSSKTMIVTGVVLLAFLVYKSTKNIAGRVFTLATIAGLCLIFVITSNPVKERYANINLHNYASALDRNNFKDFPFDGLSLRLLLWHMGNELIAENKMWLFGAGGKQYHALLNDKITQYHLYTGNGTTMDTGYMDYDMHSQYMETYMQFGIIGIVLLLTIIVYLLFNGVYHQHIMLLFITLLFASAFLTESVLETQSGILLFTIIISGEWIQSHKKKLQTLSYR